MVPALAVFSLVINRGPVDLNLAGAVVPLEIRHVVHCIPETEFHIGEELETSGDRIFILDPDPQDFRGIADRHECGNLG